MKPATLLRLYPLAWRERYGDEVLALIEQSGGGFRASASLMTGAMREWMRVLAGARESRSLADQGRRASAFYGMALVSTMIAQAFPPGRAFAFGEPMAQVSFAALFVVAASMCGLIERAAFRFILKSRATAGEAFVLCALTFVVAAVLTQWLAESLPANWLPDRAAFSIVVMFAEWFARPASLQAIMSPVDQGKTPGRPLGVAQ